MPRGGYRAGAGRPRGSGVIKPTKEVEPVPIAATPAQPVKPPDEKDQVEALAGFGLVPEEIAHVLGMPVELLREKYGPEILKGPPQAIAKVAQSLYKRATDPDKPDVNACVFWLRSMGGWSDKGETGKKEKKADAAKAAGARKFSPSVAPSNVVALRKR